MPDTSASPGMAGRRTLRGLALLQLELCGVPKAQRPAMTVVLVALPKALEPRFRRAVRAVAKAARCPVRGREAGGPLVVSPREGA